MEDREGRGRWDKKTAYIWQLTTPEVRVDLLLARQQHRCHNRSVKKITNKKMLIQSQNTEVSTVNLYWLLTFSPSLTNRMLYFISQNTQQRSQYSVLVTIMLCRYTCILSGKLDPFPLSLLICWVFFAYRK